MDAAGILAELMQAVQEMYQERITDYLTPIALRTEDGTVITMAQGLLTPGGPIPERIDLEFESVMTFEQADVPVKVSVKLDFTTQGVEYRELY